MFSNDSSICKNLLSDAIFLLEKDNKIEAEACLRSALLVSTVDLNSDESKNLILCHQILLKLLLVQGRYQELDDILHRLMSLQSGFDDFFCYIVRAFAELSLKSVLKIVCKNIFFRDYNVTEVDALLLIDSLLVVGLQEEAIVLIDKLIITSEFDSYKILIKKGNIYNALHKPKLARASFEQAVAINPKCVVGLFNLATCLEEFGLLANAEVLYYSAFELDPTNVNLISRLLYLRKQTTEELDLVSAAIKLLESNNLTEAEQETLNFALGKAHDDIDYFNEAFKYYREANDVSRYRFSFYESKNIELYSEKIIDSINDIYSKGGVFSCEYSFIFICGMFRSGTTLLEQLIAYREDVYTAGELTFVEELIHDIFPEFPKGEVDEQNVTRFREEYVKHISKISNGKRIITNKMPDNFWYVDILVRAFPNAKFIFTDREKYDVCLSVYFNQLSSKLTYSYNLEATAHFYDVYKKMSTFWQAHLPSNTLNFNYDSFISDSESVAKELHKFLGFSWSSKCLDFHKLRNNVQTASLWQVRQPLFKGSSGRYNNYIKHLSCIMN
ncbi:sulfotransferase [Pseudoalteromonas sp. SR41-4]|uniref:tetratricopeptide repeat-containing sulfotransferase family protein n=1 Tax=Pseudoalteromonas sp. SR41-4 TaxID=2760950 RepID=UPI0016037A07|nr:sulfotransferase [Pseudoalteromonas sp. SR41-4]MBB1293321.1 sulfotransferase [Pseudoalteromonas sp. SR41-4]